MNPCLDAGLASAGIAARVPVGRHVADYDYYGDFFDYDHLGNDLFGRIVKAVKKNKDRKGDEAKGILGSSVQENFEFPQELLDSLPALEDFNYEDFLTLDEQVESFNNKSPKLRDGLGKK